MAAAVEQDVLVDLVADGDGVVGDAEFGDQQQLVAAEDLGRRVHRIVDEDRLGFGAEGCGERGSVERPVGRGEAHQPRNAPGAPDQRQIAVVERLDQHHLVAGDDQAGHAVGQRLGGAGGDQHLRLPVHVEAVEALVGIRHRLAQLDEAHHRRILVEAGDKLLRREPLHIGGAVDVREALAEIDSALGDGKPRHDLEDGHGQAGIDRIGGLQTPLPTIAAELRQVPRRVQCSRSRDLAA